jgi:hypothetical protein
MLDTVNAMQKSSSQNQVPLRLSASPLTLIRAAIGGPRQIAGKLQRLVRTAGLYLDKAEIDRRLRTLEERGYIDRRPTRAQIIFGGLDMVRFVIAPAARDYYEQKGISFNFHQVLRALDDPVSIIDPTGFMSERDTIIGHVMQVVHLNPVYDLQLLEMFPDGLDSLEEQTQQMVDGTHPRQGTIGAIVEDPDYHERLLGYIRRYRANPETDELVREEQSLRDDESFAAAEKTFASLPGFIAYCHKLPTSVPVLMRRLRTLERFPIELAVLPD